MRSNPTRRKRIAVFAISKGGTIESGVTSIGYAAIIQQYLNGKKRRSIMLRNLKQ